MNACVTHAIDILRSAGLNIAMMQPIQIDADEHEAIFNELTDRHDSRTPELWLTCGSHEDLGRVELRREDGRYTVAADELSFVRRFGVVKEVTD